jgi:hypothetical protein
VIFRILEICEEASGKSIGKFKLTETRVYDGKTYRQRQILMIEEDYIEDK